MWKRYEIKTSSLYKTRTGAGFLMLTPPNKVSLLTSLWRNGFLSYVCDVGPMATAKGK